MASKNWLDNSINAVAGGLARSAGMRTPTATKGYANSSYSNAAGKAGGLGTYGGNYATGARSKYGDPISRWMGQAQVAQDKFLQSMATTSYGGGGNVGGDYVGVEQWGSQIQSAASQYGVPVNLIKAVMKLESNGDPNAQGAAGVWGPMQINSNAWGYGAWSTDPNANIQKGAEILAAYYKQYGNWKDALRHYHGIGWDGYTDDNQYADIVMGNWDQLNNSSGGAGTGYNAGTSSGTLSNIFGTGTVPDWGEFGAESDLGYYTYGTEYGMNGTQHTGVDVPMTLNSQYRAPTGGVVTCSGTGSGAGATGDGCGAFADYYGSGAGRVEVQLDNGVVLIYGHSSTAALPVGTRFSAGTVLGTSGGMNSPHIHLEARVRDSSTKSGWRIVDPRSALGGSGGWSGAGSYTPQQQTPSNQGAWWLNSFDAIMRGGW